MTELHSRNQLKHLLLDMISTSRPVNAERTGKLSDADWKIVCRMASQHRLGPILHDHSRTFGSHWTIPEEVRQIWRASFRRYSLRAMQVQRVLVRASSILIQADIPYAALKGSWLANNAYPHPALRPMRDIDVLVSVDDAVRSFELLESDGFRRAKGENMPLAYYLKKTRDMPILYCERTGVKFEIHFRVTDQDLAYDIRTLSDSRVLLSRRLLPENTALNVAYLAPADTLLHLIVHSVYDHKFNNGPLILNDVANMVRSTEIDWVHFWKMADDGRWRKGCELIFIMASHYHSDCKDCFQHLGSPTLPDDIVQAASLLLLQDFDKRAVVAIRTEIAAPSVTWRKILPLWRRAFPERLVLASFAGLDPASKAFWLGYPKWAIARSRQFLFRSLDQSSVVDIQHLTLVDRWLLSDQ